MKQGRQLNLVMAKKGTKNSHFNDGRKVFTPKNRTGLKFKDWVEVKYSKILEEFPLSVHLRLKNKEDIIVQKKRSVLLKKLKKIYIEPKHYNADHKMYVELGNDQS